MIYLVSLCHSQIFMAGSTPYSLGACVTDPARPGSENQGPPGQSGAIWKHGYRTLQRFWWRCGSVLPSSFKNCSVPGRTQSTRIGLQSFWSVFQTLTSVACAQCEQFVQKHAQEWPAKQHILFLLLSTALSSSAPAGVHSKSWHSAGRLCKLSCNRRHGDPEGSGLHGQPSVAGTLTKSKTREKSVRREEERAVCGHHLPSLCGGCLVVSSSASVTFICTKAAEIDS